MNFIVRRSTLLILCSIVGILPLAILHGCKQRLAAPAGIVEMGNVLSKKEQAEWKKKSETGLIPGTWYVGEMPKKQVKEKLPLVFVQGLGSNTSTWVKGSDNLYQTVYKAGYQTAFVQLYDAAGREFAGSQWDNGKVLAKQLQKISQHYGQKVNVIAHSKGGVDTQTALIYNGADAYVNNVITLGSPHYGSNLANLTHSWYAGWLGKLLGQKSAGTYAMQTGQMDRYRHQTDNHKKVNLHDYFTAAGTDWGEVGSYLWMGGVYLSTYGESDGVVNVWSTQLSYADHLFTADTLNHDTITAGKKVFPRIEKALTASNSPSQNPPPSQTHGDNDKYLHGGELLPNRTLEKEVAVQTGEENVVIQILTKGEVNIHLVSPTGQTYTKQSEEYTFGQGKQYFADARIQAFQLKQPETGTWKVTLEADHKDAYLLITTFDKPEIATVEVDKSDQGEVPVTVKIRTPEKYDLDSMKMTMRVLPMDEKEPNFSTNHHLSTLKQHASQPHQFTGVFNDTSPTSIYNITVDISGKRNNGQPFQRTLVSSVYVQSP
ncbi:triacylglycerol lipase [Mechercharimyces sp. CAU 1602]|uniref:esterase/lipase family protein n=1 Tax=Mechercharimyces sp. CAU 1602 TaxID=2973933 RepID=UPI002161BF82|nr:hypothetical protein [Mechercharimyces sp. CAU 1602]MCS1351327.1 hypothetical protein [Mechercharimyces sp. CAU 1602]